MRSFSRFFGMNLNKPYLDFVALAQGMSVEPKRIDMPVDLPLALKEAIESGQSSLLEIIVASQSPKLWLKEMGSLCNAEGGPLRQARLKTRQVGFCVVARGAVTEVRSCHGIRCLHRAIQRAFLERVLDSYVSANGLALNTIQRTVDR
jgi:hypothetical protein